MIIPRPRLLLFALFGLPLIAIVGNAGLATLVSIGWLATAVALAAVDAHFTPDPRNLAWTRTVDTALSLGARNLITVSLHNAGPTAAVFEVRDVLPSHVQPVPEDAATTEGRCKSGQTWVWSYVVMPLRRGQFDWKVLVVRYAGPLGFAWRQRTERLESGTRVFPDLQALKRFDALVRVGRLTEIGVVNSRRWGSGTEFERLRTYVPDDEFRRISWKATARRHQPIVRDFQPERSQPVILAVDAGRLMAAPLPLRDELGDENQGMAAGPAPSRGASFPAGAAAPLPAARNIPLRTTMGRIDFAVNAALTLGHVAQRSQDRVGLLAFSDRVITYLPARASRQQVALLAHALYNLEAEATEPDYVRALAYLTQRQQRRSLVVLFTEVQENEAAAPLLAAAAHVNRRHLLLVVTLRDPAIDRLASLPVEGPGSVYERAVARATLERRDQTLHALRRQGVATIDARAGALSSTLLNGYLKIKARGDL